MYRDIGLQDFIRSLDKDPNYFIEWAEVRIEHLNKVTALPELIEPDEQIEKVMYEADEVRYKLGIDEVTPLCILTALVKPNVAFTGEQLRSLPLRDHEIFVLFNSKKDHGSIPDTDDLLRAGNTATSFTSLQKYCINKTVLAKQGITDPIIGREKETRALIEVLGRRNKPNVMIIGEPGVGKSALVDGFAYEITKGNVPQHLQYAVLFELDLGALMAGASYKGEVEDRLKKILTDLKQLDKAVLFIDEIHVLLDSKGNIGGGVANLLKPELARGEITVIGATTREEYRKIIEPEQAFNRRFELLALTEPDTETCCKMVALLGERYTAHHNIAIDKDAIPECVRLARRYIKDKRLPDAALDLLDRTMSAIRMLDETSIKEIDNWKKQYAAVAKTNYETAKEKNNALKWQYSLLQNMVSPILWGTLDEQPDISKIENEEEIKSIINKILTTLSENAAIKREKVGKLELAAVMAAKTNIPIGKIQAQEKDRLLNMEEHLLKRVVGQDHALRALSDAIVESRSGINKPGRPIGSFFLLGPTGTGKTELAKSIAELLLMMKKQ
jgi:ATP-dependent Clp protease ATP-binding subunit ClpA